MADHIQLDKSSSTCMQPCILIIFSFGHLSGFFGDVSYFFCPQGLVFVQFSRSKSWAKPWWPDFLLIWSHLHLQNLRKIPSEFMFNRKQRPGHLLICSCTFKLASRCLLLLRCCAREANSVDCGTKRCELCRFLSSGSTCIVFPQNTCRCTEDYDSHMLCGALCN